MTQMNRLRSEYNDAIKDYTLEKFKALKAEQELQTIRHLYKKLSIDNEQLLND